MSQYRHLLIADGGNEKALREQGSSTLPTTPTKALEGVTGDYQAFDNVAIECSQTVDHLPVRASLRVRKAKRDHGVSISINGRDGRANCLIENEVAIDELIERLQLIKNDLFGNKRLGEH